MESGVFWGYVSMIDGLLSRLRAAQAGPGDDMQAIMTGGLAGLFASHLAGPVIVDADLTVKGLFEIFARNR
jgi:type III pantothenate kinase